MKKYNQNKNVYDAVQERLKTIFDEFDNIFVSFLGGKDSGLLLNLVLDYKRKTNDPRKIGVFHQDFEAQFTFTTDFVSRMFENNIKEIEPYWFCVPMAVRTAVSNHSIYWYPWDDEKKELWIRPMPKYDYIINQYNAPEFYQYKMSQEDVYSKFGKWYADNRKGKTICLLGLRTDESLTRFRAYANENKQTLDGKNWTTKVQANLYTAYPLYDWKTQDVWIANGKFAYDYNKIYDLYYKAGLTIHQMRVASPFIEDAKHSLNLYRIIEPATWAKIVGRVHGANFAAIYGGTKALGFRNVKLPKGHTWKSYVKFLLDTLPEEVKENYKRKFATSIEFWRNRGGVLKQETIEELQKIGIPLKVVGKTNYKTEKLAVIFTDYPDDADVKEFQSVPTYKRMAYTILKNDHLCKYMGFSQTKEEVERRKRVIEKYKSIL